MIGEIGEILSRILELFKEGGAIFRARSDRREAALDAIYMACVETKKYVTDWERTNRRSRKKEHELTALWKKASIKVRAFDAALADKCYFKGEYWLDPDHWDEQDTKRLGISLDRVVLEAKDLKVMEESEYQKRKLRTKT